MSTRSLRDVQGVIQISPQYTNADWNKLDLDKDDSPDWAKAVDIFFDRMDGRFFGPIKAIRGTKDAKVVEFSGFAILAIDCLLIETLGQFYRGLDKTPSPHRHHYKMFFSKSKYFAEHLGDKKLSRIFYEHFRCGILHQVQTAKESRVSYGELTMVRPANTKNQNDGLILDRDKFHEAIIEEFNEYVRNLGQNKDVADYRSRKHFKTKMDLIVK
jgi:hypothetical protein